MLEENRTEAGLAIVAVAVCGEVLRRRAEGHIAGRAVIVYPHQGATRLHLEGIKFVAREIHYFLLPQVKKCCLFGEIGRLPQVDIDLARIFNFIGDRDDRLTIAVL